MISEVNDEDPLGTRVSAGRVQGEGTMYANISSRYQSLPGNHKEARRGYNTFCTCKFRKLVLVRECVMRFLFCGKPLDVTLFKKGAVRVYSEYV